MRILLLAVAALATVLQPAAADPAGGLTPHKAEYKVTAAILDVGGRMTTHLARSGGGFRAVHQIEPSGAARVLTQGTIRETSDFDFGAGHMLPSRYSSRDTITRDRTGADVEFDWSDNRIYGTVNGEPFEDHLDGLVHDRVSIQYELMQNLQKEGVHDAYVLFDIDEYKSLQVEDEGSKRLRVPAGSYDVVGVAHQKKGSKRRTTLWCAEQLDYLPVLIEQHRDGKLTFRARLVKYMPEE